MYIKYLLIIYKVANDLGFKPHSLKIHAYHWPYELGDFNVFKIQMNFCFFVKMVKIWELSEDNCYKHNNSKGYKDISRDLSIAIFKRF